LARAIARYLAVCVCLLVPLAIAQHTGQWVWSALILVPLGYALIDKRNRTLYDIAAGTRMVVVPIAKKVPGL
jgi:uncharacterized RDD family membrane protein YckC